MKKADSADAETAFTTSLGYLAGLWLKVPVEQLLLLPKLDLGE
jgi:hypothetical protein